MTGYRPGARYLLIITFTIMLACYLVSPAAATYLPNGFFLQTYSFGLDSAPVLCNLTSAGLTVTDLDNGNDIVTTAGTNITIDLMETDPNQNWGLANAVGVDSLENNIIVAFPLQHQFVLRAQSSCVVLFLLVDSKNNTVIKKLEFNLIVDPPVSGIGWPEFSPAIAPSFGWPVELKFTPGNSGSLPLLSYEGFVL